MSEGSKRAQKRIAKIMKRVSSYRTYPINKGEAEDIFQQQDRSRRAGLIDGLGLALAIIIECEK